MSDMYGKTGYLVLVSGGSASGKSDYAEELADQLAEADAARRSRRSKRASETRKIYFATMKNDGEEAAARIEKHRAARADRGFLTVECLAFPKGGAIPWRSFGVSTGKLPGTTVLLEDLPNLLANEMFAGEMPPAAWQAADPTAGETAAEGDKIVALLAKSAALLSVDLQMRLAALRRSCGNLIIVTDEIFSDGGAYDAATGWYLLLLGMLHQRIAAEADAVVEVVCGIPVIRKGKELPCFSGLC